MANYDELERLFTGRDESAVEYSFEQLEEVIGEKLPASARIHYTWWRAAEHAPWRAYGWKAYPNLPKRKVLFRRESRLPNTPQDELSDETVTRVFSSERRLILLAGVSGKCDRASPAKDLYQSALWVKRRTYAEATSSPWVILSSEYGVVHPDTVIEPYDADISSESVAYRREWSNRVAAEIIDLCNEHELDVVEAHAGAAHLLNGLVAHLNAAGLTISWPLRGRRIGEQLSWYDLAIGAVQSLPRQGGEQARQESAAERQTHTGNSHASPHGTLEPVGEAYWDEPERAPPRLIVYIASLLRALWRPIGAVGPAIKRWVAFLAAELSRRSDRSDEAAAGLSLSRRVKLAERIAEFGETRDEVMESEDSWTGDIEVDRFILSNPFAFLAGLIMDQTGMDRSAWDTPWLLRERLGHLDPERILAQPEALTTAMAGPPALHRSSAKVASWIRDAAEIVVDQYGGDVSSIWSGRVTREQVRKRLEGLPGIGPRQSARGVDILQTRFAVEFAGLNRGPLVYEADLRRVMLRTGLAQFDDIEHMTMSMSDLYPEDPGSLDLALFTIGKLWCHPVDPDCDSCAIGGVCPRFVELSGGTPTSVDSAGKAETGSGGDSTPGSSTSGA